PVETGQDDRSFHARWREESSRPTQGPEAREHGPVRLGRAPAEVLLRHPLPGEGGGLERERLGGPGFLAGERRGRDRPFLDREERFTRDTVEKEDEPLFADLRHRVHLGT